MRPAGPLSLRPFRRLIGAYVVNSLGTWSGEIALAVLVLRETGSPAAVSAVFLCGMALPALFSPALTTRLEEFPAAISLPALLLLEALCFGLLAMIGLPALPLLLLIVTVDGVAALSVRSLDEGHDARHHGTGRDAAGGQLRLHLRVHALRCRRPRARGLDGGCG